MYSTDHFREFIKRHFTEEPTILLINNHGSVAFPYATGYMSDYNRIVCQDTTIPILRVDPEFLQEVLEAQVLQSYGLYEGELLTARIKHNTLSIPDSRWPVLFTSDNFITYQRGDGWVEQYALSGQNKFWWIDETERVIKTRSYPNSPLSQYFKEPLNFYRNPLGHLRNVDDILLESDEIYWGDSIYYNPRFQNVLLAKEDSIWKKYSRWYFEEHATGEVLEEYRMVSSLFNL